MSDSTSDSNIAKAPNSPEVHESGAVADQNEDSNVQSHPNKCLKQEFAGPISSDLKKGQRNEQQQQLTHQSQNEHLAEEPFAHLQRERICRIPHVDLKNMGRVKVVYADEENTKIHNEKKDERKQELKTNSCC